MEVQILYAVQGAVRCCPDCSGEVWQRCAVQGAVQSAIQTAVAKSGKGAVQDAVQTPTAKSRKGAVQGALQGAV